MNDAYLRNHDQDRVDLHAAWSGETSEPDQQPLAGTPGFSASLPAAPAGLVTTRQSLTALAFYAIAPTRHAAEGRIGMVWTKGCCGTPSIVDGRRVRIEGGCLVDETERGSRLARITTLGAAGEFLGVTPGPAPGVEFHDAPPQPDLDETLTVDEEAVGFLGAWFGFGDVVLHRLHAAAGAPDDTSVQLWPEHFDMAIELGDGDAGTRASYGVSPGDDAESDPYIYVAPWTPQQGEFWSAPFGGAALTLSALREAPDPVAAALAFFEEGRRILG